MVPNSLGDYVEVSERRFEQWKRDHADVQDVYFAEDLSGELIHLFHLLIDHHRRFEERAAKDKGLDLRRKAELMCGLFERLLKLTRELEKFFEESGVWDYQGVTIDVDELTRVKEHAKSFVRTWVNIDEDEEAMIASRVAESEGTLQEEKGVPLDELRRKLQGHRSSGGSD